MTVNKIYILVINWYFYSSQMESYHAHSTLCDEKQPKSESTYESFEALSQRIPQHHHLASLSTPRTMRMVMQLYNTSAPAEQHLSERFLNNTEVLLCCPLVCPA